MRISKLVLIFFFCIASLSFGQDVKSSIAIDTNNLLIGEQFTLKLEVESKTGFMLVWPQFTDTLGKFEIIKRGSIDTLKKNNQLILTQKLKLTSFEAGTHIIEPFTFVYEKSGSGNLMTTISNSLPVTFTTMAIDTSADIKDIKKPIEFPITFDEVLPYIIYTAAAIILLIVIILAYKKFKKKPKEEVIRYDATIPADLEALEALKSLSNEKLWQKSLYKEHYTKLSEILRTFVHRRYHISTFEATSDEVLKELESKDVPLDAVNYLKEIFYLADMVKFAKMQPIDIENNAALENSYKFVNMTKEMIENIDISQIGDIK
ncbi:MAG TPA: hypothetical protein PLE30_09715 [Candidatus Kapabacteria bacterium]|nr:hypothetical protein [Candidatus Kapabacteria bacterium]